jgi:H+/Cl- antiporter ClcA
VTEAEPGLLVRGLLGQEAFNLVVGVHLLLGSMWLARREPGSCRGPGLWLLLAYLRLIVFLLLLLLLIFLVFHIFHATARHGSEDQAQSGHKYRNFAPHFPPSPR